MAGKYEDICKEIVTLVGGKENIRSLTHCVTRLRFTLNDDEKADKEGLESVRTVLKVVEAGGQCQVVVGAKVNAYYDTICELYGLTGNREAAEDEEEEEGKKRVCLTG